MNKYPAFLLLLALPLPAFAAAAKNLYLDFPNGDLHCSIAVSAHIDATPGAKAKTEAVAKPAPITPAADPSARGVITAVDILRVGRLQHTVISWSDDKTSEAWTRLDNGMTILEATDGAGSFYEFQKGSQLGNHFFPLILDLDQASLGWIDKQHFTGQVVFDSEPALHFQKPVTMNDAVQARTVLYQAWVDPKTLTLLAMDDGAFLYKLTFTTPPPKTTLVIPPRFQAELLHYEAAYAKPVHR
jgi:hypothetical protein